MPNPQFIQSRPEYGYRALGQGIAAAGQTIGQGLVGAAQEEQRVGERTEDIARAEELRDEQQYNRITEMAALADTQEQYDNIIALGRSRYTDNPMMLAKIEELASQGWTEPPQEPSWPDKQEWFDLQEDIERARQEYTDDPTSSKKARTLGRLLGQKQEFGKRFGPQRQSRTGAPPPNTPGKVASGIPATGRIAPSPPNALSQMGASLIPQGGQSRPSPQSLPQPQIRPAAGQPQPQPRPSVGQPRPPRTQAIGDALATPTIGPAGGGPEPVPQWYQNFIQTAVLPTGVKSKLQQAVDLKRQSGKSWNEIKAEIEEMFGPDIAASLFAGSEPRQ